jgi:hypothetical protein
MDGFFYRIGLVDQVTMVSKAPKEVIIKRLKDIMDIPFHTHEQRRRRIFQGEVSDNEFSFRRKKGFLGFDQDSETLVKVIGTIKETKGEVIISAKIVGQKREFFMTWTMIGVLFMMISIFLSMGDFRWDIILLLIGVLAFFVLHRYSNLRKGVSKMTRTVDLELNTLARQENAPQQNA